jgi:MYXO-CTERM domain-containing protein
MKKATKFMGVLALTAFLGFSSPVVAQTTDNTTTTTRTADDMDDDNDDDSGKWGLAGLLGLLGLLGLKRRDDDRTRTNVNR